MKITVLGSAGFGYPLVFCNCEYCKQARVVGGKNIRKRASLLINDELIIDLTPDCQVAMNMYGKDMGRVKYLLQTHTHLDHFDVNQFTTLDLKYETKRQDDLCLVCSDLCLKDIQTKVSQFDRMNLFDNQYLTKIGLEIQTVNHGESITVDKYFIKAIHCAHDEKIGSQIYLIKQRSKSLLYATDTPQITEIALKELDGEKIDCIFLDESFGVKDYSFSHLNIESFKEYIFKLKENNLLSKDCSVFATHLTHDENPLHEELEQILNQYGYHVAYDGMEIQL